MSRRFPRGSPQAARCALAAALWAAGAGAWLGRATSHAAPASPPSVVLVTLDTTRADRLGCYGYGRGRTPVLDALAHDGIRFERAFAPAPLTLPAHASLLTGAYPSGHGVRDNSGFVLGPEQVTLAEMLKAAGYRTAAFVGAFVLDSKFGLAQGFDTYHDAFDLSRYESVSPGYIQRPGDEVVAEAIGWLEREAARGAAGPFFLWAHLYDPHDPYTPPEPYRSRHPGRPYDGEIEFTDRNVGTLLGWLRRQGLYDGALVAVVGDHGEAFGEHGEAKHGFFVYNTTLHVPWLLKLPRSARAGSTVAANVSTVDLVPTLLQALALQPAAGARLQGKGLLALVLGKAAGYRADILAECAYPRLQFGWSDLRALITDRHKYVLAPRPELYRLDDDFGEEHDLGASDAALANRLRERLRALADRFSTPRAAASRSALDPETRERLRSLGYVAEGLGETGLEERAGLRDPKDEIGTYRELTALFEQSARKEFAAVIPRYEAILRAQPDLKIVHFKLGQAYFRTGAFEAAAGAYRRAIELGGDGSLAVFDLAQTYLRMGRTADALDGFRRAVALDPSHYRARTNLGELLRNQGKVAEAIAQLEAAVALAPRAVPSLSNLGIAYSDAGRHADAEATLRRAVALAPGDGRVRANLAAALGRAGRHDEARREMETARRLDPRLENR